MKKLCLLFLLIGTYCYAGEKNIRLIRLMERYS